MKNLNNRLFDELNGSKITKKSMAITKGGTDTSDSGNGTSDKKTLCIHDCDVSGGKTTTSDADISVGH